MIQIRRIAVVKTMHAGEGMILIAPTVVVKTTGNMTDQMEGGTMVIVSQRAESDMIQIQRIVVVEIVHAGTGMILTAPTAVMTTTGKMVNQMQQEMMVIVS